MCFLSFFFIVLLFCFVQYFERRFDRRIRIFGSCLFVLMNVSASIGCFQVLLYYYYYFFIIFTDTLATNMHLCACSNIEPR